MLVLSRKPKESIMIGDSVEIQIIEVKGDQVKIGILAPKNIIIHRKEIYNEIRVENLKASKNATNDVLIKTLNKLLKNSTSSSIADKQN